jgi:hypothetical protein
VKDQEVKQHLIIEQEVFQLSSQSGPEAWGCKGGSETTSEAVRDKGQSPYGNMVATDCHKTEWPIGSVGTLLISKDTVDKRCDEKANQD